MSQFMAMNTTGTISAASRRNTMASSGSDKSPLLNEWHVMGRIEGAPLWDLIMFLLDPSASEEFCLNCIFCHRSFPSKGLVDTFTSDKQRLSSLQFLEILLLRFLVPPATAGSEILTFYWENKTKIQSKILRLLITWVKCVPSDWTEDDCLLERHFRDFVKNRADRNENENSFASVLSFIEKKKAEEAPLRDPTRTTRRVREANQNEMFLTDFWPENLAAEWSLIEAEIARNVRPRHLLKQDWLKNTSTTHPVNHHLQWFNETSKWIEFEVLRGETAQDRANIISQFISIGVFMRALNNFSSLMQIYSALDSPAISRLKHSWDLVPEYLKGCQKKFGEMMSPTQNYSQYRAAINAALKAHQTAVPFFGMTLQDFTFYEEAPDNKTEGNLDANVPILNFQKMRSMSRELQKLFYGLYNNYAKVTTVLPNLIATHFGSVLSEVEVATFGKFTFKKGQPEECEELSMASRSLPRRFMLENAQNWLQQISKENTIRLSYAREPREAGGPSVVEDSSFVRRSQGAMSKLSIKGSSPEAIRLDTDSPRVYGQEDEDLEMNQRDWQLLRSISSKAEHSEGHVIIAEGQMNDTVYLVAQGVVRVEKKLDNGEVKVLKKINEGECFGEMSMLNKWAGTSSASVVVESPRCILHVVPQKLLDNLLNSEYSTAKHFWAMLAKQLAIRYDRFEDPEGAAAASIISPTPKKKRAENVARTESEVNFVFKSHPDERRKKKELRESGLTNSFQNSSEKALIQMFELPHDTVIIKEYFCTLKNRIISLTGSVCFTHLYICFYAQNLGQTKKKLLPFAEVTDIKMKKNIITVVQGNKDKLKFEMLEGDVAEAETMMKGLWMICTEHKGDTHSKDKSRRTNNQKAVQDFNAATKQENRFKKPELFRQETDLTTLISEQNRPNAKKAEMELSFLKPEDFKVLTDRMARGNYIKGQVIQGPPNSMFQLVKGTCNIDRKDGSSGKLIAPEMYGETRFMISLFNTRTLGNSETVVTADEDVEVLWMENGFLKTLLTMDTTALSARFFKTLATILARRLRNTERISLNAASVKSS
eukprot:TRINITY_DN3644_c0_g1_i5.p1 TRINITY_DN3644_c0_g1~~TRINITY_DN3644_c0_g1_i5.p1  ORF type:complete len:1187 (-),score=428.98 TRINITY_DN3644_c0_g1_i5:45-3200(-)